MAKEKYRSANGLDEEIIIPPEDRDTIMSEGWGRISRKVMIDENLSPTAKNIYCYLSSYTGEKACSYPSRGLVMKHLRIGSMTTYYKAIDELKAAGYLTTVRDRQILENGKETFGKVFFYLHKSYKEIEVNKEAFKKEQAEKKTKSIDKSNVGLRYTKDSIEEKPPLCYSSDSIQSDSIQSDSIQRCSNNNNSPNNNNSNSNNSKNKKTSSLSLLSYWPKASSKIIEKIGNVSFNTWFITNTISEVDEYSLKIITPNDFSRHVISSRYLAIIQDAMREAAGRPVSIIIEAA